MYYTIQVKSGSERKVMLSLQERVDKSLYDAAFTPMREMNRKFGGKWIIRKEILFPGYIFIDSTKAKELSLALVRLPEFAKMLGKDSVAHDFLPLSPLESRTIDLLCGRDTNYTVNISTVNVVEGKIARILSGPLMGNEGRIQKVNLHKRQVTMSVSMFSRTVDVVVGIDIIQPND